MKESYKKLINAGRRGATMVVMLLSLGMFAMPSAWRIQDIIQVIIQAITLAITQVIIQVIIMAAIMEAVIVQVEVGAQALWLVRGLLSRLLPRRVQ